MKKNILLTGASSGIGQNIAQTLADNGFQVLATVRKIEDKETPFVTVEFSLEEKRVLQCYGHNDTKPDFAVVDFVDKWAEKAKRKVEAIQRKVA